VPDEEPIPVPPVGDAPEAGPAAADVAPPPAAGA
jgi:hypothetical protein